MVSIAESSVASVPLTHIMQLQEKLLQQPVEPEAQNDTRQPSGEATSLSLGKDVSNDVAATVSESANARLTSTSSPHAPRRLAISKSATAVEMEAMVNPSPSQEAFVTMTRASSFHGCPAGDTQPLESQVYRDFRESMVKSATTTPAKAGLQTSPDGPRFTHDTWTVEKTPQTYVEGDTGFIDLANAIPSPGAQSASSFVDDLATSPTSQVQEARGTRSSAPPETPTVAGYKRTHSGEPVTSAITTHKQPAFSQLFGTAQAGPLLSATQAFNETQAPSSPLPNGPRSDPIFTRPSPTLPRNISTSSPTLPMSTPGATMRPSTAGEPRDRYTSMRESQERRAARLREEIGLRRDFDDDILEEDEDEEMDAERRRFENRRMQRVKSEQALAEFARIRAPSRPGSRPTSSPKTANVIDLRTPAAGKKDDANQILISDDGGDTDDDVLPEDEGVEEAAESDDEYDELGQTVLRSQRDDAEHEDEEFTANGIHAEENVEMATADDVNHDAHEQEDDVEEVDAEDIHLLTQHSTIADSQPMQQRRRRLLTQQHLQQQSSATSFVPASQRSGRPGHDQATLHGSENPAQTSRVSMKEGESGIRSSPPLPGHKEFQSASNATHEATLAQGTQQVIPESDLPASDDGPDVLSRPATASASGPDNTNDQVHVSTAQTHLSRPAHTSRKNSALASPLKTFASQHSNNASQSPLTAAGVRKFADITAMQSPPKASNGTESAVDAIMNDVMTADDRRFVEVMSSPVEDRPSKKRRTAKSMPDQAADEIEHDRSEVPARMEDHHVAEDVISDGGKKVQIIEDNGDPSQRALQESPSKANEMPPATPESVRAREEAGAKAVSQIVSTRASKPTKQLKLKGQGKASTKGKHAKPFEMQAALYTSVDDKQKRDEDEIEHEAIDTGVEVEQNLARPASAPQRIFAFFKGQYSKYYPATWQRNDGDSNYFVKFDDGTEGTVEKYLTCRLELRMDDQVKVDMPKMRSNVWLVKGFRDDVKTGNANTVDSCGHAIIQVQAKKSGTNVASSIALLQGEGEFVDVPVSSIYLTTMLWPHYMHREFVPPTGSTAIVVRAATPSSGVTTPAVTSPPSRSRRNTVSAVRIPNGRSSLLREEITPSAGNVIDHGLFANMAFAISVGTDEREKAELTSLIQCNGGLVLDNGFDELFDPPSLVDSPATSPSKRSPRKTDAHRSEIVGLKVKSEYENLGFVALIADRHSRRAKYMQALALGLPTLSIRWISDSLDPAKNSSLSDTNATPLPWTTYLLAAGESSYLAGATRSRNLQVYPALDASLSTAIARRSLLLKNDGVLIVASKKGKIPWERRKAYLFLTLALGAGRVKKVSDLYEAKALSTHEPDQWKWIYVDGSVAEAEKMIFGKVSAAGQKRKRNEDGAKNDRNGVSAKNQSVGIVNDEFVVQSLILGALVD